MEYNVFFTPAMSATNACLTKLLKHTKKEECIHMIVTTQASNTHHSSLSLGTLALKLRSGIMFCNNTSTTCMGHTSLFTELTKTNGKIKQYMVFIDNLNKK